MTAQSIFEALEEADVGAYAVSVDQAVVFWNRAARRILGHSPEDVIGRRCYEVLAGTRPGALTPSCREGCPSIRALQARQVPEAVSLQILSASGERKAVFVTPMVVAVRTTTLRYSYTSSTIVPRRRRLSGQQQCEVSSVTGKPMSFPTIRSTRRLRFGRSGWRQENWKSYGWSPWAGEPGR